ncbi:sprT-like domain-containing protein Spartan [Fopius arisanus]|uniref:SprT-like domain-containing protein Spartan n=1 Tax=Fopius arisanus TaxID=64838 RepID=A0A9R1UAQ2_9HYME|nr:PREDICTED: sprT-like domain-containing protein Spartan [Fopius arisanus]
MGIVKYVGLVLGPDPNYRGLARLLDERFFDGRLQGFTVWRTKDYKSCFGYTDFLRKKIVLQECLFYAGMSRTCLVRILVHEMCHAHVDILGGNRAENGSHGPNWRAELERLNLALQINIEDESDVDWRRPRESGLNILYRCEKCGRKQVRGIRRPPDASFYSWFSRHEKRCGGAIIEWPYESWDED